MSQETASEAFERTYIASLAAADKNFVLNPDVPWPTLRTKANPMAEPTHNKKRRRKGVQSNDQNRNRFIVLAFALIFCDSPDKQLVLGDEEQRARLYDDGRYSWIEDTVAVLAALRNHYSNVGSRRQAFMAFRHLCEALQYINTRDIYGNAMDTPDGEELNPAHEEPQETPGTPELPRTAPMELDNESSSDQDYYHQIMDNLAHTDQPMEEDQTSDVETEILSPAQMIQEEMQLMQQQLYAALGWLIWMFAVLLLRYRSVDEEAPPPACEDITGNSDTDDQPANDTPETTGPEFEHSSASAASADTPTVCTPTARRAPASNDPDVPASIPAAAPASNQDADGAAALLELVHTEDNPSGDQPPDRRTQETYQGFLGEYQQYIEQLRLRAMEHLESDTMDVSQWRHRHNQAIHAVMAYLCLATMYGDVDATLEPVRLDWCDAKFVTALPTRLADCMYVLVTTDSVSVHLRGGHKNGCDVDRNISETSPLLAEVLRLWMPHAQTAQPENNKPHVMLMHVNQKSYGQPFSGSAYGKLLNRTWTGPDAKELAAPDPHADAKPEENPKDRHGYGCDWARKVVSRARRGVIYADQAAADQTAAAAQGHSDETERLQYRTVGLA